MRWRRAMEQALYGPAGFYVTAGAPAANFRTSVHASSIFVGAIAELLDRVDRALERPDPIDVVDVGAGRGELLTALLATAPTTLVRRVRASAVELAPRPAGLPDGVGWTATPLTAAPSGPTTTGLVLATEWLDNVPLDLVEVDADGVPRYVCAHRDGTRSPDEPVTGDDAAWLRRWWPLRDPGTRAEIGAPRDDAWAATVGALARGLALTVDYGHFLDTRPTLGTLTGYRAGRQVPAVPDGSMDITAHVALDAVADAGARASGVPAKLLDQRTALRRLGVAGGRPPLALASTDPAAYVRALAAAGAAAELTDPAGLGGHSWIMHPVGIVTPV